MTSMEKISAARDQLNRTLTFFPRVDSKASLVFGINTGLLAVLATRSAIYTQLRFEWIPIGLTLLLLGISFGHLYKEAFPSLKGGQESLLYFNEIAKRTEAKYIETWKSLEESEYLADLLGQVWRNSEILKQKFEHVKWAFYALALALVPWLVALAMLTMRTTTTH